VVALHNTRTVSLDAPKSDKFANPCARCHNANLDPPKSAPVNAATPTCDWGPSLRLPKEPEVQCCSAHTNWFRRTAPEDEDLLIQLVSSRSVTAHSEKQVVAKVGNP
jgi:hypothetical protein